MSAEGNIQRELKNRLTSIFPFLGDETPINIHNNPGVSWGLKCCIGVSPGFFSPGFSRDQLGLSWTVACLPSMDCMRVALFLVLQVSCVESLWELSYFYTSLLQSIL